MQMDPFSTSTEKELIFFTFRKRINEGNIAFFKPRSFNAILVGSKHKVLNLV